MQRLGLFSAKRRWTVVIAWLVILGGLGTVNAVAGGSLSTSFSIPGTPSQKVNDQLEKSFPDASGGSGQIVFATTDGDAFTAAQQTQIGEALDRVSKESTVVGTVNPFATTAEREKADDALTAAESALPDDAPAAQKQQLADSTDLLDAAAGITTISSDGATAVATVAFSKAITDLSADELAAVRDDVDTSEIKGVEVNYSSAIAELVIAGGASEAIGIVVAAVALFIMLGSFVAAGLPLLSAILGVAVGSVGILAMSAFIDEPATTTFLGLMLGLAVGIDYALFILNRHRRNLRAGVPMRQSIGLATGTSGNAVLFAGLTVIIALVALNVTGIGFLGIMGTAGAACIAIAVLVALTFTPAMLSFANTKIVPKKERHLIAIEGSMVSAHASPVNPGRARKTPKKPGGLGTRHPVATILVSIVVLLVIAIPAGAMRLGLPDASSEPASSTQYKAYTAIGDGFGAGTNATIIVVANAPATADDAALLHLQAQVADKLMGVDNVVAAAAGGVSADKQTLIFQLVPREGPNAVSTEQVVKDVRALSPTLANQLGVTVGVTGLTATNIDLGQKLADALPLYLLVVLGLSILILILVFRSILIPLIATAGFLLSVLATFGAVTAVFQFGWGLQVFGLHTAAPILSYLPTLLVGIVFGLAMDYQLFLVSGIREAHERGLDARAAVREGLGSARSVITVAAIIMIGVFSGFALSGNSGIVPIGFGLAFGVLVDAFVVRMLLIPAAMTLLGEAAWWLPRWLQRILPDVDIEGASLEKKTDAAPTTTPELTPAGV